MAEPAHVVEPLASREGPLPVSYEQQAIWFHEQLTPKDQTNAHDQDMVRLELARALDGAALERALLFVLERHESLRTTYEAVSGLPRQRIQPAAPIAVPYTDLRGQDAAELDTIARALQASRCDLKKGPLVRAHLVTLAVDRHVLFLKIHHIAFDGWSANVLAHDLSVAYEALSSGKSPELPPLPLQVADHAADQRRGEETGRFAAALGYWKERLAGAGSARLPLDRPPPKRATYRAATLRRTLDGAVAQGLRDRARRDGTTLYAVLASAVAGAVGRATGSEDVCLGMLTAGRNDRRLHDVVGCFLNVLPLRIDLSGEPTPSQVVARTAQTIADAFAHDAPYDVILRSLARPRTEGPLFEVSVILEVPVVHREGDAFELEWVLNEHEPAAAPPLTFMFIEHGTELRTRVVYKTDLFDAARIEAIEAQLLDRLATLAG